MEQSVKFRAIKRIAATVIAQLCILSQTASIITVANAYQATGGQLGTQQSLGSPLLNNNISADDFNPWEQIVFGIYLSNYTQPFVDSYEQAFQTGAGYGSNGAGAQSLQFSAGSEATNEDIIKGMLNIAINMENNVALQPVYVTYSNLSDGKLDVSSVITQGQQSQTIDTSEGDTEPDSGFQMETQLQRATLSDLFFAATSKDSGAYMDVVSSLTKGDGDINGIFGLATSASQVAVSGTNTPMVYAQQASIPTFVLMNSQNTGYKAIVLDYCDSYDIQSFATAAVKAQAAGDSYGSTMFDSMTDGFEDLSGDALKEELNKYPLQLDCFGNIVTEVGGHRYVVYPACLNQHLTETSTINLINQLVMNGTTTQTDSNSYVLYGGFHKNEALFQGNYSGISALNNGNSGVPTGQIAIYFDTDSLIGNELLNGSALKIEDANSKTDATNEKLAQVNWGENLKTVFNSKLGAQNNKIQFKMQVVNPDSVAGLQTKKVTGKDLLYKNAIVAQSIFQNQNIQNKQTVNTDLQLLYNSKATQSIFGDSVAVQVMTAPAKGTASIANVARQYVNFVYQSYNQQTNSQVRSEIDNILSNSDTRDKVRESMIKNASGNPTQTLLEFWKAKGGQSGYWQSPLTQASQQTLDSGLFGTKYVNQLLPTNWKVNGQAVQSSSNINGSSSDADITTFWQTDDELFGRTIVLFQAQNITQAVQAALNLKSGADFETYATDVYYTYLKFYGILNDYGVQNDNSKLNPNIFSKDLVSDLTKINELLGDGNYMTSEQKMTQILDGTYTLLQRSLDRDYNITDFIYNQYYKMVFGRSQQTTVENNIQTRSANGFLQVHTYSENFLTAFFIENYAKYQAAILIFIVFIVIVKTALSKKGVAWGIGSIVLAVNLILLMPSIGEITPYLCNLIIQNSFQNSMQFWQISETLNNYNADQGLQEFDGLSDEELQVANNIYKSHTALNVDHTLMLKLDISKKIMSTDQTDYTALQQLQTTRWLLPMIIQQWQAQDNQYDYVQVTLGSEMDNISNMYWQYKPQDAANKDTVAANKVNSSQFNTDWDTNNLDITKVQQLTGKFAGYSEVQNFDRTINDPTVLSRSILYTKNPSIKDRPSNYFYILDENYPLSVQRTKTDKGKTDWDSWYASTLSSTTGDFNAAYNSVVKTAQTYDQSDPNTVEQSYGYLWTTQNPLNYFYFVVKESMNEDYNLNDVYNVLSGDFVLNATTGKEDLRKSDLMYIAMYKDENDQSIKADTQLTAYGTQLNSSSSSQNTNNSSKDTESSGYVYSAQRDVLDLNHLFTNVVPYLYEMTLASGGTGNGTDGFFSDDDIIGSEYPAYEGNLKSWLFRSNWAIKVVENSSYNKKQTIRDADGNRYTITSTWDPKAYPEQRPMVFSRAQQILEGLDDSDLTTFELKCVELNENICNEWTKLINYINLDGMSPEVIYREMQLIALLEFNKTFQPQSVTGSNFVMYPYTLDIRYISFDSIMRMLMLNVSKDTQYIYNNTMQTVINNSDIFTAVVLLLAATLCSGIVPFLRDILMALIFYLGLFAVARQLFVGTKNKLRISSGVVMCNLMVAVTTLVYYQTFSAMMGVTTYDSVLDIQKAQITTGTPLWCFLVTTIVSAVYVFLMYKMGVFVWKNKSDMGFEAIAEMARSVTSNVNSFAESVGQKFQDFFNSRDSGEKSGQHRAKDISGSGDGRTNKENSNTTENVQIVGDSSKRQNDAADEKELKEYDQANYQTQTTEDDTKDFSDSKAIDAEIEKGKQSEE